MKTLVIAIVVAFALVAGSTVVAIVIANHNRQQNNLYWCSTLELLTKHPVKKPVDPASNPSRVNTYNLYIDFKTLEKRFGCQ